MTTATQDLDEECIHLLTRRFCALCNGTVDLQRRERDLEVERVLALGGWFPARYGGRCAKCGERFSSGCPITKSGQFENRTGSPYVAMCCAPADGEDEE